MLRPVPRKNNYRAPWILVAPSIVSRRRNGRAAIVLKITTFALRTTVGRCHLPAPLSPRVTTFLVGSADVPFSDFSPRYSFVRRTRRIAQLPFYGPFVFEIQFDLHRLHNRGVVHPFRTAANAVHYCTECNAPHRY